MNPIELREYFGGELPPKYESGHFLEPALRLLQCFTQICKGDRCDTEGERKLKGSN
jgi:hypothetical protein